MLTESGTVVAPLRVITKLPGSGPHSLASGSGVLRANDGPTVVTAVGALLAGLPSGRVPDTVTVFVTTPAVVVLTTMVAVAVAPVAMLPRLHVTMPAICVHVPWDALAET